MLTSPIASPVSASGLYHGSRKSWTYDGTKWVPSGLCLIVAPRINDNRIINGDMRIDQRNNGASGTANGFTLIVGVFSANQTVKGTWREVSLVVRTVGFRILSDLFNVSLYVVGWRMILISLSPLKPTWSATFSGEQRTRSRLRCRSGSFQSDRNIWRIDPELCWNTSPIRSAFLFRPRTPGRRSLSPSPATRPGRG